MRDGFRAGRDLAKEAEQERQLQIAQESLEIIKRQVMMLKRALYLVLLIFFIYFYLQT